MGKENLENPPAKDPRTLVDGKYSIKDLVDLDRLRKIFEKFSKATGATIGFVSFPEQEILIATGWRDICTRFHRIKPEAIKACLKSNISMTEKLKKAGQINIEPCDHGLVDAGTPIIIKGVHIATLATGQVFFTQPDIERFRQQALLYDFDVRPYLEAVRAVPVVTEEQFKLTISFLGEIALLITELGYRNLETKAKALRLEREVEERKKVEYRLKKINEAFVGFGRDPVKNIQRLTSVAGELLGADSALYNRLQGKVLCSLCQWNAPAGLKTKDKPSGHICFSVIKKASNKVAVIRNLQKTDYFETDPNVAKYNLQTYVGAAVKFGKEYVGTLCAVFRRDFVPTDDDKRIVGLLAAAIGIEEDRKAAEETIFSLNDNLLSLNSKLKRLALIDSHTGLYNHRYLVDVIETELSLAKRLMTPLSVIMLDIDYFKSINDVYGHQFGDLVLKQFAKQLRSSVRRYDVVVRFGGEEFVVISPGLPRQEALVFARRLLDNIYLCNFGDRKHKIKIKLSAAVASYPEDEAVKGISLINIVDKVLAKSKEEGGNRVYSSDVIKEAGRNNAHRGAGTLKVKFLKDKIEKLTRRGKQSVVESIFAFAKTLELRDHYTGEHVEQTVQYATEIAKVLNLPLEITESIRKAAVLHDLGKIGISDKTLHKKTGLSKKEATEIRKHPQIAADIIRPIQFMHDIIPFILHHHERWDGKGYPAGLKGRQIPIGARIIAVADVYQALTSNRPYHRAYSKATAMKMIKDASGAQFDPEVVAAFLNILSREKK